MSVSVGGRGSQFWCLATRFWNIVAAAAKLSTIRKSRQPISSYSFLNIMDMKHDGTNIAHTAALAVIIVVVGTLFAAFVIGPMVIDPRDVSWMESDPKTHYLGWSFFRLESTLRFPLGWSSYIGFPLGEPIAYLDSVPVIAVVLWPLRHLLPINFQYLGLYFALCCMLQLLFGYRICLHITRGNRFASFVGGVFFLASPIFVNRGYSHFALASHWLILAAFDFFLLISRAQIGPLKVAHSGVVCFLAGSINPYIAFMAALITGGAYTNVLVMSPTSWRRVVIGLVVSAVMIIVSLTVFGFVRPGDAGLYSGWGYERFAINLVAIINPMDLNSIVLKPQPNNIANPSEGYNYLGLGIILLLIVSLSRRPTLVKELFKRRMIAVWLIVVVSTALALSLRAVAGDVVIYDIPAPPWVINALSIFRASGRLFWPAYYLIVIGAITAASDAFEFRWLGVVLLVAFAIQIVDLRVAFEGVADAHRKASSAVFTDKAEWQSLGRTHRHLVTLPAWQCDTNATPGGADGFWIFGKLAVQQHMTVNSFYAARTSPREMEYFCKNLPAQIARDGFDFDTAYVFANARDVGSTALNGHFRGYGRCHFM